MDELFKRIGIGLTYIITSPLWIIYFALYFLYGILNIIIAPFKIIYYKVHHRKYTVNSHYDVEAEQRLNMQNNIDPNNNNSNLPQQNQNQIHININYPFNPNQPYPGNNGFSSNPPQPFANLNNNNVVEIENKDPLPIEEKKDV